MSDAATPSCAILIPAFDEEERVGRVVAAARGAALGPVLVIDDGSSDDTAPAARSAGADVLRLDGNRGKAGAVLAGADAVDATVIVLLDADLKGLQPSHVQALARPVLAGEVDMTRGVFAGGRWATTAAQHVAPALGGQRAVLKERLLELGDAGSARFGLEVRLERAAQRGHWRRLDVPLADVSQVMKEEKRGWWRGVRARLAMYRDIVASWVARG